MLCGSSGCVQDLACVLRVLRADHDVVRPAVPSPSPAPAPLFVNRGRHSMPAPRRTEQSSSASGSLPATSTTTQSSGRVMVHPLTADQRRDLFAARPRSVFDGGLSVRPASGGHATAELGEVLLWDLAERVSVAKPPTRQSPKSPLGSRTPTAQYGRQARDSLAAPSVRRGLSVSRGSGFGRGSWSRRGSTPAIRTWRLGCTPSRSACVGHGLPAGDGIHGGAGPVDVIPGQSSSVSNYR
jgi:hypothetical protein